MEPITNNEFLNSVLEAEAWKEIPPNGLEGNLKSRLLLQRLGTS